MNEKENNNNKKKDRTSLRIFLAGEESENSEKSSFTSSKSFRFIFTDKKPAISRNLKFNGRRSADTSIARYNQ